MKYIIVILLAVVSVSMGQRRGPDVAPKLGAKAPSLKAQKLGSKEVVDLGAIKKTTVLIFGSYT